MKIPNRDKIHFERCAEFKATVDLGGQEHSLDMSRSRFYEEMGLTKYRPQDISIELLMKTNPIAANMFKNLGPEASQSCIWEEQQICCFVLGGKRVFHVSKDLTDMLTATDFKIQREHFQVPFNSFYMSWASSDLWLDGPDGSSHPLEGYYVSFTHETHGSYAHVNWKGENSEDWDQINFMWVAKGYERSGLGLTTDDNLYHVRVDLDHSDTISSDNFGPITTKKEDTDEGVVDRYVSTGTGNEVVMASNPLRGLINLAVNTILYITSENPDLKDKNAPSSAIDLSKLGPKKKNKMERKLEKISHLPYTEVGETIKIPGGSGGESCGEGTRGKLSTRIEVRGHWRMQPYGEERAKIKRIWIKPHFKGPDTAELVHREFEVT